MKQNKDEELQNRRQFFKKAAKATLPILGAIVLSNVPLVANASESENGYCGCSGNCSGSCQSGCKTTCYTDCYSSCKTGCNYTCKGSCAGSCNAR